MEVTDKDEAPALLQLRNSGQSGTRANIHVTVQQVLSAVEKKAIR